MYAHQKTELSRDSSPLKMNEAVFLLGPADRAAILRQAMQSIGCCYICLWSYFGPPSNLLLFLDGVYVFRDAGSRRLFESYSLLGLGYSVDDGRVPGLAFKNNLEYLEITSRDLHMMTSTQLQLQFYQECGIKTVAFMGCPAGEIEFGLQTEPQLNLEVKIKKTFSTAATASSSSSSSSTTLFNDNSKFPSSSSMEEEEELEFEGAILAAVLSSSSSKIPQPKPTTAFTNYHLNPFPKTSSSSSPPRRSSNMFMRVVCFYREMTTAQGMQMLQSDHHLLKIMNPQLHHIISERRRREKLNESFHLLRSLLPSCPKKDKASVLSYTTEYIAALKIQVEEVRRRNQALIESRNPNVQIQRAAAIAGGSSRLVVLRIGLMRSSSAAESSSSGGTLNLTIGILDLLKQFKNVTLLSLELPPSHPLLILTLQMQGDEYEEAQLREGVARIAQAQSTIT